MSALVLRQAASAAVTLLVAAAIAFLLTRLAGDPTSQIVGEDASPEQLDAVRRQLGFDQPLPVQFLDYIGGLFTGDLGESLRYNTSNWDLIASRLPFSITLGGAAMLLAVLVGVPLGVLAAVKVGSLWDRAASVLALLGQSVPLYWFGLILISVFALNLNWLPAGQAGSYAHLILPAVSLATLPLAHVARLTRSSMVEALQQSYVEAARARGLSWHRVTLVHALRNAALPVLTVIGLQAGSLLTGTVTIEFVFGWPGLGTLAIDAVNFRDFPLVQAIVLLGALVFILVNLCVDLTYAIVDPRIRESAT